MANIPRVAPLRRRGILKKRPILRLIRAYPPGIMIDIGRICASLGFEKRHLVRNDRRMHDAVLDMPLPPQAVSQENPKLAATVTLPLIGVTAAFEALKYNNFEAGYLIDATVTLASPILVAAALQSASVLISDDVRKEKAARLLRRAGAVLTMAAIMTGKPTEMIKQGREDSFKRIEKMIYKITPQETTVILPCGTYEAHAPCP